MPKPASSLGPTLDVLKSWWALNHAVERSSRRMQRELGISGPQRVLLRLVDESPGIGPAELARLLSLDPGTISSTLGKLEDARLVARAPTSDGRRVALQLTAKGKKLARPSTHTIESALERVLAKSSSRSLSAVRAFFTDFADELDR